VKKVLIIHPEGNSFNNPSAKAIIDMLCDKGVEVTMRYQKGDAPTPKYRSVIMHPWGRTWGRVKRLAFDFLCSKWLALIIVWLDRNKISDDYDLIIGIDRQGLIEAYCLHVATGIPYIFWSFEIMFASETSISFKRLEIEASRFPSLWYAQDKLRVKMLISENLLKPTNGRQVPVASSGIAEISSVRVRDLLGIPEEKKVAILIGSLADWTMSRDIIFSVQFWPDDWCLIIHERYAKTEDFFEKLPQQIKKMRNKKIYVSNHAVDCVDKMGDVLNGCTAGIAFYKPINSSPYTGRNLACLGLASGKISTFLRYGLPVVTNEIGEYTILIRESNAGLILNKEKSDLHQLLNHVDYEVMSANAKKLFHSRLDFKIYEEGIWSEFVNSSIGR
jgi:hypothetical protein